MKQNCIIMDANIITEYKNSLNDIKQKVINVADIFIPRVVIGEIEGQKSRNIKDDYRKIKSLIDKNSGLFEYSEKFNIDDIIIKIENDIKKWLEAYCDKNIIEHNEIELDDVIERSKYKKAPFINEQGSSDKGFKDSTIWLSILKNNKIKSYKKIILLTNDKAGFIKRTNELYDEYNQGNTAQLTFCCSIEELYKYLGLDKSNVATEELEKSDNKISKDINDIKTELNNCIENILFDVYEDNWGNIHHNQKFNIYKKMNIENVECFLELLDDFLKDNIFFYDLDITELLSRCGIECAGESVSSEQLNKLNEIYKALKGKKKLYNPFINFLKKEFNKLYKHKSIEKDSFEDINDTDLPF